MIIKICLFFLVIFNINAGQWNPEWGKAIVEKIETENANSLLTVLVKEEDLKKLRCQKFNEFTKTERAIFWSLILKSIAKAESNFNPIAKSRGKKSGSGNYGLLQISKATARVICDLEKKEDLFDPEKNLFCGILLLQYQLQGGTLEISKKPTRPDSIGKIFTSPIFFWGPLRAKDFKGRNRFISAFQNDQDFKICQD